LVAKYRIIYDITRLIKIARSEEYTAHFHSINGKPKNAIIYIIHILINRLDQYRNSETLSKKRKLSGGKKTRKHKK